MLFCQQRTVFVSCVKTRAVAVVRNVTMADYRTDTGKVEQKEADKVFQGQYLLRGASVGRNTLSVSGVENAAFIADVDVTHVVVLDACAHDLERAGTEDVACCVNVEMVANVEPTVDIHVVVAEFADIVVLGEFGSRAMHGDSGNLSHNNKF